MAATRHFTAPLDEGNSFAVFWSHPLPATLTHGRCPSQHSHRFDRRRPHWSRQDRAVGGDPGHRLDLGRCAVARDVVSAGVAAGGAGQRCPAGTGGRGVDRRSPRRGAALTPVGERIIELYRSIENIAQSSAGKSSVPWASWYGRGGRSAPEAARAARILRGLARSSMMPRPRSGCCSLRCLQPSGRCRRWPAGWSWIRPGRQVEVPDRIERVIAAGPPASVLLTILAPEKLIGWNRKPSPEELPYLPPVVRSLPEIGRLTGRGGTATSKS